MDLKTTFLKGNLEEEIYMDQPIGFVSKAQENKFVILNNQFVVSSSLPKRGILDFMKPLFLLA